MRPGPHSRSNSTAAAACASAASRHTTTSLCPSGRRQTVAPRPAASLDPEAAAQIGYIDEVVAPDELLDRAVARADRLGRRLKYAVAAVKRAAYIGSSRGLEEGLHLESAEFLSTLANPGAQKAMLAYLEQTAASGDLPLYDPQTYERIRDSGHFG